MVNIFLFIQRKKTYLLMLGVLLMVCAPSWAAVSSTDLTPPPATVKSTYLLSYGRYFVNCGSGDPVASINCNVAVTTESCKTGFTPKVAVAVSGGASSNSTDKAIRGYYLDPPTIGVLVPVGYSLKFSKAYTDVIDSNDVSVGMTYWLYCVE